MEGEKAFKCCLEIRGTNGSAKILDGLTGKQPGAQTHKNECTQDSCPGSARENSTSPTIKYSVRFEISFSIVT